MVKDNEAALRVILGNGEINETDKLAHLPKYAYLRLNKILPTTGKVEG